MRWIVAIVIVLVCSTDVRAQVLCQQIGIYIYCGNNTMPSVQILQQPQPQPAVRADISRQLAVGCGRFRERLKDKHLALFTKQDNDLINNCTAMGY